MKLASLGILTIPLYYSITDTPKPSCSCRLKSGCRSPGKHPRVLEWTGLASKDPDQIRQWYEHDFRGMTCNLGIATGAASGIVCLDIDIKSNGEESLAALVAQYGPLPPTWEAKSGGGGRHLIFRHPGEGIRIGNQQNKGVETLGPGLDIRGDGGQFVAPPSLHTSGRRYEWLRSPHDLGREGLADLPAWILPMLVKPERTTTGEVYLPPETAACMSAFVRKALQSECEKVINAPPANANNTFNNACFAVGTMVGAGMVSEEEVAGPLMEAARQRGQGEGEIAKTFRSAIEAGKKRPRVPPTLRVSLPPSHAASHLGAEPRDASSGHDGAEELEAHDNRHRLARLLLDEHAATPIRYWQSEFWRWRTTGGYKRISVDAFTAAINSWIDMQFRRDWHDGEGEWKGSGDNAVLKVRAVTSKLVHDVRQAIAGLRVISDDYVQPVWLCNDPPFPAKEALICRNGIVHLPSLVADDPNYIIPLTPDLFSPCVLDYEFDPHAPEPVAWNQFLAELWPDDPQAIALLQEWFGYCLLPDTSRQKILIAIGPRRSGKGTVARILTALVGEGNVAGPTLSSLANEFGLQQLLGKTLAIFADARLNGRPEVMTPIVERLLSISGEDMLSINRKNSSHIQGRLLTRLMILTNESPRLSDASGALTSRFVVLPFHNSFYDREDFTLESRLRAELPGILLWAIQGWQRLQAQRYFTRPASAIEIIQELEDLGSPVAAFVRECCVVGPEAIVEASKLFEWWQQWCKEQGKQSGDRARFGRDLKAAFPDVIKDRPRMDHGRTWCYKGIGLAE